MHGFPDISAGWRYQMPMLLSLGLRVVAPDCMGYGRTVRQSFSHSLLPRFRRGGADEEQDAPPYTLRDYGFKRVSDDMAELARQLGAEKIILGGHDWYVPVYFLSSRTPQAVISAQSTACPLAHSCIPALTSCRNPFPLLPSSLI
jgi:pimeloyl-ACP methyl ester carboxylesterase